MREDEVIDLCEENWAITAAEERSLGWWGMRKNKEEKKNTKPEETSFKRNQKFKGSAATLPVFLVPTRADYRSGQKH